MPHGKSSQLPTPVHALDDPTPLLKHKLPGCGQGRRGDGRTVSCVKRGEGEAKDGEGAKCGTGKSRTETPHWKGNTGTAPTTGPLGTQHGLFSGVQQSASPFPVPHPLRQHGNKLCSCVTIRAKSGLPRMGAFFESSGSCLRILTSMLRLLSRRHCATPNIVVRKAG